MKKRFSFIVTICVLLLSTSIFAQDLNGVYFVFSSENGEALRDEDMQYSGKVYKVAFHDDENFYKDDITIFEGYSSSEQYVSLELWHFYMIRPKVGKQNIDEKDQHKTYIKDVSFLNSVACYHWNDLKNMTALELRKHVKDFIFNKKVYAVDLSETLPDGKVKIYEVEQAFIQRH